MTIEYVIITALSFALLWQTWRKRVWRQRAISKLFGFWHVFQTLRYTSQQVSRDVSEGVYNGEWPELINEKATNNEKSS